MKVRGFPKFSNICNISRYPAHVWSLSLRFVVGVIQGSHRVNKAEYFKRVCLSYKVIITSLIKGLLLSIG